MDRMLANTTYDLDLPTLLQFLQDQSAVLSTPIAVPHAKGLCHGYLLLKARTIVECQIQSQDGTVLYKGQRAYSIVSAKTQWQVRLDSIPDEGTQPMARQEQPKSNTPVTFPILDTFVPKAIASLEASLLDGYTVKWRVILRTVFAMINGQRSVKHMKGQLNLSSETIDEALTTLRSIGVIE
jgi:hypothetical protein